MTCGTPPNTANDGLDHWPCRIFLPGELSVQKIFPVFLSTAIKLGAEGDGTLIWASSTPLLVLTNRMSPESVTEQLHILCWEMPSVFIMSNVHSTSGSSVVPSLRLSISRHFTSPRLVTYQSRCPSTNGAEQTPSSGQSLTRPPMSFSLESCQRNFPSAWLKQSSTPRSTVEA